MQSVSIEEARRTLGELVDRARLAGEATMITRHGKASAVIVSADWYQRASAALEGSRHSDGKR
jgi:prevent-host-death family protein